MRDYTIFGYTNCRYANLAAFWASKIELLNLNYLIYCTDKESHHCLSSCNKRSTLSDYQKDDNAFDFNDFGLVRFKILSDLLRSHENVIYSDLDAIWIDNPIGDLLTHDFDGNLSTVHHPNAYPPEIKEKWGSTVCTGWMHFKNTCVSLIDDFIKVYGSYSGNDQGRFNKYLDSICAIFQVNHPQDHSFTLNTNSHNLKFLGLNEKIIFRREEVYPIPDSTKVLHPVLGIAKRESRKIRRLKRILNERTKDRLEE